MKTKGKGNRNEHRRIRLLESAGYTYTRAAASLAAWDVIAVGSSDVVLRAGQNPRLAGCSGNGNATEFSQSIELPEARSPLGVITSGSRR